MQEFLTDEEDFSPELETMMHRSMRKVSEDIERMKFNTAIATMMSMVNEFYNRGKITRGELKSFLILLNPFAPHLTEEMWQINNFGGMLHEQSWVKWDDELAKEDLVAVPVQINGKIRGTISISVDAAQEDAKELALADENIAKYLAGKTVVKEIFVPGKIYSFVVK